jgi:hypothetical protein
MPVTEEGMQIDESDEQWENPEHGREESREPDSNVTTGREGHPEKQESDSS